MDNRKSKRTFFRTYLWRLPGHKDGVFLTVQSVSELKNLVERLGLPGEAVPVALALTEQLRYVTAELIVSDEAQSTQNQDLYSEYGNEPAAAVRADIAIGMATKGPKSRLYNQAEQLVLLMVYGVGRSSPILSHAFNCPPNAVGTPAGTVFVR